MSTGARGLYVGILVAGAAAACTDGLGQGHGTYVLRTVGDSTVPFVEFAGSTGRMMLLADTLALDGRGNAVDTYVVRQEPAGGAPFVVPTTSPARYVVRSDTVYIQFRCPPNAACAVLGPEKLAFVSGGLATTNGTFAPQKAIYERIR